MIDKFCSGSKLCFDSCGDLGRRGKLQLLKNKTIDVLLGFDLSDFRFKQCYFRLKVLKSNCLRFLGRKSTEYIGNVISISYLGMISKNTRRGRRFIKSSFELIKVFFSFDQYRRDY
jgi:hypothetical protein